MERKSIFIAIVAFINISIFLGLYLHRYYFWDEILYAWLASEVLKNPFLIIHPKVAWWVPHPPLFWYYLALTWILPIRFAVFLLNFSLIIGLLFLVRRWNPEYDVFLAFGLLFTNSVVVMYSITIFNDLPGNILSVMTFFAYEIYKKEKNKKLLAFTIILLTITGYMRYLPYFFSIAYIGLDNLLKIKENSSGAVKNLVILIISLLMFLPLYLKCLEIAGYYNNFGRNPIVYIQRYGFMKYISNISFNIALAIKTIILIPPYVILTIPLIIGYRDFTNREIQLFFLSALLVIVIFPSATTRYFMIFAILMPILISKENTKLYEYLFLLVVPLIIDCLFTMLIEYPMHTLLKIYNHWPVPKDP
ncbi:MAG: hypothetical protein ACP6IQ_06320 [Candidatus Njordarchaeia archaeon]